MDYNKVRDIHIGLEIFERHGGVTCDARHDVFHAGQRWDVALTPEEIATLIKARWMPCNEGCAEEGEEGAFAVRADVEPERARDRDVATGGVCAQARALTLSYAASGLRRAAFARSVGLDDDTLTFRLRLGELILEVAEAVDEGQVSMSVALIGRDAAFFEWPRGERQRAISPQRQRYVLQALRSQFPRCARGAKARTFAARVRDESKPLDEVTSS